MSDEIETMESHETSKIDNIENTTSKNTVRQELANAAVRTLSYLKGKGDNEFNVVSLCGKSFFFEQTLNTQVRLQDDSIKLNVVGVEWEKPNYLQALSKMPENFCLAYGRFDQYFTNETVFKKYGVGFINDKSPRLNPLKDTHFAWADYCCNPDKESLEGLKPVARSISRGILAITFSLNSRQGGGRNELAKEIKKTYSVKGKGIEVIVVNAVKKIITKIHPDVKVNCIYNVIYGGGKRGSSRMITVAFSIDLPLNIFSPIFEDRTLEKNVRRYMTIYSFIQKAKRVMGIRKFFYRKFKGRTIQKVTLTKEQRRVDAAVEKWEAKWERLSKERKEKIAKRYGVSVRSFACRVACRHGKLAERRLNKEDRLRKLDKELKELATKKISLLAA